MDSNSSVFFQDLKWQPFLDGLNNAPNKPGVYVISQKKKSEISAKGVEPEEVNYVGETTSVGGLKSRLRQFKRGTESGSGHSCGNRLLKEKITCSDLLVAYKSFDANTAKNQRDVNDLHTMAKIKSLEYEVMAEIRAQGAEHYKNLWNIQ